MTRIEETLKELIPAARERGLPFLLIGGNAMILLGYIRNTLDVDFLVPASRRSPWLDLLHQQGFRLLHGTDVFAQFEQGETNKGLPLDLMFVNPATWETLSAGAKSCQMAGEEILMPCPEHLIALKLHAASSPDRERSFQDWEDIRQIIRCCQLDTHDASLQQIILRHGGDTALQKVLAFKL